MWRPGVAGSAAATPDEPDRAGAAEDGERERCGETPGQRERTLDLVVVDLGGRGRGTCRRRRGARRGQGCGKVGGGSLGGSRGREVWCGRFGGVRRVDRVEQVATATTRDLFGRSGELLDVANVGTAARPPIGVAEVHLAGVRAQQRGDAESYARLRVGKNNLDMPYSHVEAAETGNLSGVFG